MRLSRHCYDKPHRCPGWAGGGWKYPDLERCPDGRLRMELGPAADPWCSFRWHRCDSCDIVTLPIAVQWFDPTWLRWWVGYRWGHFTCDLMRGGRTPRPGKFIRYRYRVARINWRYRLQALWTWYGPGSRPMRSAEAEWRRGRA